MDLVKILDALSSLAYLYGPFFFALLFGLFFTKKAHGYVQTLMKRTKPPAEEYEKRLYGRYFITSMVATLVLTSVSVAWWMYAQMQLHTFQGVIQGVNMAQTIVANENDVYLRTVQRDAGPGGTMQDYHFAIVSAEPFKKGQQFLFDYYPDNGSINERPKAIPLFVTYTGNLSDKYRLIKNESTFILSKEGIND